jgi:hypothetical protein
MKKGDKLYCKKQLVYNSTTMHHLLGYRKYSEVWFNNGEWYEIVFINVNDISIKDNVKQLVSFSLKKGIIDDRILSDYFYTEKELRKIKLNKIINYDI